MPAEDRKIVSIFGTSKASENDEVFEFAHQVGKGLAENGFVVANGDYGGTMLASAKGAREAGGEVVGVTCSAFGRGGANEYVSREIVTGCLAERLEKLVTIGDGYVVLAGGTGTLLELAEVWELKNKGFAEADKPIIIAGTFWEGLVGLMGSVDPGASGCVETVRESAEVVEKMINCLQ